MDKEDTHIHTSLHTHIYNGILFSYKKKEILMSATTKMNLEGMRISEKIHTEKDEHSKISLI